MATCGTAWQDSSEAAVTVNVREMGNLMNSLRQDGSTRFAFLDVGAHRGQSAEVALGPLFRFQRVVSFEPDPACVELMRGKYREEIETGRFHVIEGALGSRNGERVLVGENEGGGATVLEAASRDGAATSIVCREFDVAEILRQLADESFTVFIKLNCEGAEVEILDRICHARLGSVVRGIMVDFDIVKYAGGIFEKRRAMAMCRSTGLPLLLSEQVMVGTTHSDRIRNWLARYPEIKSEANHDFPVQQSAKRRLKYWLRDIRSAIGLQKHKHRAR